MRSCILENRVEYILDFNSLLVSCLELRKDDSVISFAGDFHTPPPFSSQVNFPRLELVLEGIYENRIEDENKRIVEQTLKVGDAVYIPPNCWNKPKWNNVGAVLSILFGKRQLGFSYVRKEQGEEGFSEIHKHSIQTRTGFAIDNILEALNALSRENNKKLVDDLLVRALIQYSSNMLRRPRGDKKERTVDLYQGICIYIQENYHKSITRDSIADRFNVSANHVSRLFKQKGHMTLAEYIIWVRIDRAKFMLRKYNFKLVDVSERCGFKDVNYFCRVFKKRTGNTPSQYRNGFVA
ncbi:AraC family transcriptional regulator [Photobacterium sp. DNB23_23_1]